MSTPFSYRNQLISNVQRFEDFFRLFQESPRVYKYQDQIRDIYTKNSNTLVFLIEDLITFDPITAEMVIKDPETLLEAAIEALKNILLFFGAKLEHKSYHVRVNTSIKNTKLISSFKDLNSTKIAQLVFCRGICIRYFASKSSIINRFF